MSSAKTKKSVKKPAKRTTKKASPKPAKKARKAAPARAPNKKVQKTKTQKSKLQKGQLKKTNKPSGRVIAKSAAKKKSTRPQAALALSNEKGKALALEIARAASDKVASNIEIIEVIGLVDYTDYVVVMSGRSDRQVAALARSIDEEMNKQKARCISIEGLQRGVWVLMDYGDVIVHIFHEETRDYYDLDSLWLDAKRIDVPGEKPRKSSRALYA